MAYIPKEGRGSLFKNDQKIKETHPDYKGSIMINNKEHYLSAWVEEGKNGKYFSVSIGNEKQPKGFVAKGEDELPKNTLEDSDLPF